MKYYKLLFLLPVLFGMACGSSTSESETETTSETEEAPATPIIDLTLKWETDTLLTTCESVLYDPTNDVLYVSNIEGAPDGKDGRGSIGKVSLDGTIINAKWIKGLNAPKGLGLYNGMLYVSDLTNIVEIDIVSEMVKKSYPVKGASFLNDITVDANGKVYVSDSRSGLLAALENGKVTVIKDGLQSPNGLFAEENRLMVASFEAQTLNTLDLSTLEMTVKTEGIENTDGIEAVGNGGYLVSSWNGKVHYVTPDWEKVLILDTTGDQINAADIEFIPEKNLLLVPTFFKNKVMAYELKM